MRGPLTQQPPTVTEGRAHIKPDTYINGRGESVMSWQTFKQLNPDTVCKALLSARRYWPRRYARVHNGAVTTEQLAGRGITGDLFTYGHAGRPRTVTGRTGR
jgi:hypothetical protein